ncbi:MAG: M23 family metallopeptidase [candidate division WOR-3 bacterium]|nr:MAG: M23 family metallopeptidase [candidate division WOR-3 bacterium]
MYRARLNFFLLLLVVASCARKTEITTVPIFTEAIHIVKRGENLEGILDKLTVADSRLAIINALQNSGFPFRKCLPGDSIFVVKKDTEFSNLTYRQNLQNIYYVTADNSQLVVSMKYPYFDTVVTYIMGSVNSTLYESMLASGETSNLVIRFADIFAWEIDFFTETQHGDSFSVCVDKIFCDSTFFDYGFILFAYYKGEVGEYYGFYYRDPEGNEDYYNKNGQSLRKSLLKSPLRYSYISSHYSKSRFHPILKRWRPHHGLDYVAPIGTPVASIGDGRVTFKGWKGGYGNLVEIRHKNNFTSRYGHLKRFAKNISVGRRVKSGQLIGYLGSTGLSTGPHLHFELHKNGTPINPLRVKIPRAPSVKKKYMDLFKAHRDSVMDYIQGMALDQGEAIPET